MFNILTIVFFAVVIGSLLAVYMTKKPPPQSASGLPESDKEKDDPNIRRLTLEDLKGLAVKMFEENGLELKETISESPFEEYWVAENKSEFYSGTYVFGLVEAQEETPLISMQELLAFKDFVKGIEKNKGFLFTTGFFVREVHQPLEGVPVSLYNRLKVIEELKKRDLL